jgi:hypothetical protein
MQLAGSGPADCETLPKLAITSGDFQGIASLFTGDESCTVPVPEMRVSALPRVVDPAAKVAIAAASLPLPAPVHT